MISWQLKKKKKDPKIPVDFTRYSWDCYGARLIYPLTF